MAPSLSSSVEDRSKVKKKKPNTIISVIYIYIYNMRLKKVKNLIDAIVKIFVNQ